MNKLTVIGKTAVILLLFFTGLVSVSGDSYSEVRNFMPWDKYDQFSVSQFKSYGPANSAIDFQNINYQLLNAAIFYETNRMRQKYGRSLYRHSDALERAALMHSIDMVRGGFFDHTNYNDRSKRTPSDRSAMFGGEGAGENIATTFGIQYEAGTSVSNVDAIPPHTYNSFAVALVNGWMNSPGHRANILDEHGSGYQYLGCGAYPNPNDRWHKFHATQNFSYSGKGSNSQSDGGSRRDDSDFSDNTDDSIKSDKNVSYTLPNNNLLISSDGRWIQQNSRREPIFSYTEKKQDENFIYLYDNTRDLWLAVPLSGGKLYYRYGANGEWQDWFNTVKGTY